MHVIFISFHPTTSQNDDAYQETIDNVLRPAAVQLWYAAELLLKILWSSSRHADRW